MKGVVYKSTGNWYDVHTDSKEVYKCNIKGKFRSLGIKSTNPIAVGDRVDFEITDHHHLKGLIIKIDNRENYIIRKSVNLSKQTHIIASNIDCCFLFVTPSNPQTSSLFIDRVLVSTKSFGIETIILFNKIDIYSDEDHELINNLNDIYTNADYKTLRVSVKKGTNIDLVKQCMKNKVSVFFKKHQIFADNVGLGGGHVTSDISMGLKIPMSTAERIKTIYGGAMATGMDDREMIETEGTSGDWEHDRRQVSRSELIGIIRPRMEEILEDVRDRLNAAGFDSLPGKQIVLTGGASQTPGLDGLAARILSLLLQMEQLPILTG